MESIHEIPRKKQGKDLVFVDESDMNRQNIKEYPWSEKELRSSEKGPGLSVRGKSASSLGSVEEKSWHPLTSMTTRIPTILHLVGKGSMSRSTTMASCHDG
jgi:hypothetical protein